MVLRLKARESSSLPDLLSPYLLQVISNLFTIPDLSQPAIYEPVFCCLFLEFFHNFIYCPVFIEKEICEA